MTSLTRRRFVLAAAGLAVPVERPQFFDGQTVHLGATDLVLTDILAPSPSPLHGVAEPGAAIAADVLQAFLENHRPPPFASPPPDRWGRASGPALFLRADGARASLQQALLEAGAARVFPQSDDDALLDGYFAAEDAARAARAGLWGLNSYAVRAAVDVRRAFGFQIYRGVVRSTGENRGRVYFNFGEDFRVDVTATATLGAFRRWRRGRALTDYAGSRVEVRGVVDWINGPSLDLRHERQLRLI